MRKREFVQYSVPEFDMAICHKPLTLTKEAAVPHVLLAQMESIPCDVSKFTTLKTHENPEQSSNHLDTLTTAWQCPKTHPEHTSNYFGMP